MMKEVFSLTVSDILKRNHFDRIRIIAGETGLGRIVKWVHVVEVIHIRKLLKGQELILSTGLSWKDQPNGCLLFIQQLIESNASGLCIEMDPYTSSIPNEVIEYANLHQFPIILFEKEVPFVEITQDIHTLLINKQYKLVSDLENYSQSLNKKLLLTEHYHEILQFLHNSLDLQVIFRLHDQEIECVPELQSKDKVKLKKQIETKQLLASSYFAKVPIQLLGYENAELMILSENKILTEFDHLILDRTATALAQYLLRNLYVEEKKRIQQVEWILDWLNGKHLDEQIKEFLIDQEAVKHSNGGVVCVCKYSTHKSKMYVDATYFKLLFRTIFEQQGFISFTAEKRNEIIFILVNQRTKNNWKQRLSVGIARIKESEFFRKQESAQINIGVGKFVDTLSHINRSYQTAEETIRIQQKMNVTKPQLFYEDLHLFRLISIMNKQVDLHEFVLEYLHPVLEYDRRSNGKLLETLRVYLKHNGSKQETAKSLFIVRQTLYHRIGKLEKLLGEDFMSAEKRVAIEFMLLTYDYLLPSEQKVHQVE
jgi:PucR family transcriptional regulator, purine catabolism regulatory protein